MIPNLISGDDSFGIVKRENNPAIIIKNTTRNDTLYLFTQNQKNHFRGVLVQIRRKIL